MRKDKKLFASPALWVIILFVLLFAALEYRLSLVPNSYNFKNAELIAQSKNIECLVLGSSHGYFDIKPDELSVKTFNLANTSQSLAQDLALLKHFIDRLPKLKAVVIPISYFTLEYSSLDSLEDWRDCYTFHFLGASEAHWWKAAMNPQYLSLFCLYGPAKVRELLKSNFRISYAKDTDGSGWYFGNYGSAISAPNAAERVSITEQSMKSQYIEQNRQYLEEILSLCKNHHLIVVLITTPVHDYYYQELDKTRWSRTQKIVSELAEKYNAAYFDYSQDKHFTTSDFRDNDHLNQKGAVLFSRILDRRICQLQDKGH